MATRFMSPARAMKRVPISLGRPKLVVASQGGGFWGSAILRSGGRVLWRMALL